jgi:hypothetical protein
MSHDQLLMAFLEDEAKKPAAAAGAAAPPVAEIGVQRQLELRTDDN